MRVYYVKFRKFQDSYKQDFYSILCSQKVLNLCFEAFVDTDYKTRLSSFIIGFFGFRKKIIKCRSPPFQSIKK